MFVGKPLSPLAFGSVDSMGIDGDEGAVTRNFILAESTGPLFKLSPLSPRATFQIIPAESTEPKARGLGGFHIEIF